MATSANLAADMMSRASTNTGSSIVAKPAGEWRCTTSYAATSSAVSTKSVTAILVYVCQVGCAGPWSATAVGAWAAVAFMSTGSPNEVDDGENDDPDHVHEMPVQGRDLQVERLLRRQ